jgi:hypothetical protein
MYVWRPPGNWVRKNKVPCEKSAAPRPEGRLLGRYILLGGERKTHCPSTGCTHAVEVAVIIWWRLANILTLGSRTSGTLARSWSDPCYPLAALHGDFFNGGEKTEP